MSSNPMNNLRLHGIVSTTPVCDHQLFGETFFRCTIGVNRLSGAADELPLTFSSRIIDPALLTPGTEVTVLGQVRAYKKLQEGHSRLCITAFARSITVETLAHDNQVTLSGRLLRPAIHRVTPLGREITDLLFCVKRTHEKNDCLPCIAWGRNAAFISSLPERARMTVFGRLQSRAYQKKHEDGSLEERTAYEISISAIELLPEDTEEILC